MDEFELKILGVTVNGKEKIHVEMKRNEVLYFPRTSSVAESRIFLVVVGWFREFINGFADITNELIKH